jgi:hypothetical protein
MDDERQRRRTLTARLLSRELDSEGIVAFRPWRRH